MRSNEEQTKLILEKYEQNKKESKKLIRSVTFAISSVLCVVLVFCAAYYLPYSDEQLDYINPDNTDQATQQSENNSANENSASENGVYIPAIEIGPVDENVMADMVAMVVYNSRVYVGAYQWDNPMPYIENAELLGEYVGTGNNKITCWSDEKDYEGQFASNTPYNFYTVKGYDPVFRLAAVMDFEDGKEIMFFDCLNGIWLHTGADLYENLLHITGNYNTVLYQLHEDWDYGKGNYKTLSAVSEEDIAAFVEALKTGPFVDFSEDIESRNRLYDGRQAHLFFQMNDGTTVGMRLLEGGYVSFRGTSAYVYMPGEIFDVIFNATT
ncbi:MAG: hypothetical protein IKJ63_05460 [Clostridia bacterium]|nr:hypothetical protein [Clostridia bacterium]